MLDPPEEPAGERRTEARAHARPVQHVAAAEAEVRDAVVALLSDWVGPGVDAMDRFVASVADEFTGLGTAPGEYFRNRNELRAMTARERGAMPYPFTLRVPWMNVRLLRESMALAEGELAVEIRMEGETFVEAPRFSLVLEREERETGGRPDGHPESRWVLLHFHMSVPDAMQREGDTMGDLLTTRNRELEREVTRRTDALREQTDVLRTLNETNAALAAELDLEKLVQRLVDAGRDVIGAVMGAFFYNVEMREGVAHADFAVSGVPRAAFAHYPLPRMTEVFRPTFHGESMLRSDDMLQDPRYGGNNGTHGGMPPGHPPVRSFLSSPVTGRDGQVIGGLLFGHAEPNRFTKEHEAVIARVANQAAIAITNARLYEAAQAEIEERRRAEAALAEAKSRAEAANRAKSTFLASMSHELRTPLNGILGYAQLLQRDRSLTGDQRAGLNVIESSGRHLLTLINDVLDLSKIEARKLEVEAAPFRLPKLLGSVADIARVQAEEKGLTFAFDAPDDLPVVVQGDERRLRQVLLNLLSNAVKFTERGAVALRARVTRGSEVEERDTEERDALRLRFEVEDTGMGIAPEQAGVVFEAFEQARETGRHSEGTGLGLAISRRLAGMMGGTLHLASTSGQGSLFALEVPLPVLATREPDHQAEVPSHIVGVAGQPKVLVVDDKPVNRSVVAGLLVPLGFDVAEAADGLEAVTKAETFRPDVVLMDLVMPVLDGFEASRRLRQSPVLGAVPIVALSASVFDATQQESLEMGCDAFLPKPVEFGALLDTLGQLLELEWIYEPPPEREVEPSPPGRRSVGAVVPTPKEAAALYDLALRGDVEGLLAYLDASRRLGGEMPFGARLRMLARHFRMQEIRTTIEPYLHPKGHE